MKSYKCKDSPINNYKLFPNKDLAQLVRKVFGTNIVSKAYYVIYDDFEDNIYKNLTESKNNIKLNGVSLKFNTEHILIEFVNGNKVLFTNSEWASMTKIKGEINES